MVLRLKTWESRSLPGLPSQQTIDNHRHQRRRHKRRLCCLRNKYAGQARSPQTRCSSPPQRRAQARSANKQRYRAQTQAIQNNAGWSSPVARQAHNLKVVSSNLAPATNDSDRPRSKERGFLIGCGGPREEMTVRTKPAQRAAQRQRLGQQPEAVNLAPATNFK